MGRAAPATTEPLRVRAEVLCEAGRPLWDDFMAELTQRHLDEPVDPDRETVGPRLQAAYVRALAASGSR